MDLANRLGTDKEGQVNSPATLPDTNDREEVSSHPANRAANDDGHPNKLRGSCLAMQYWRLEVKS